MLDAKNGVRRSRRDDAAKAAAARFYWAFVDIRARLAIAADKR